MTPQLLLLLLYTSLLTIFFIAIILKGKQVMQNSVGGCIYMVEADEVGFVRLRCVMCRKIKVIHKVVYDG